MGNINDLLQALEDCLSPQVTIYKKGIEDLKALKTKDGDICISCKHYWMNCNNTNNNYFCEIGGKSCINDIKYPCKKCPYDSYIAK